MQNLKFPIQKRIPSNHTYFCPFSVFFHTFDTGHTLRKKTILDIRIVNLKKHLKKKQDPTLVGSLYLYFVNFLFTFSFFGYGGR